MQFQKEIQEAMKLLPDDQYSAIAQQVLEKQLQQAHDMCQQEGMEEKEMYNVFNMGIGMILVVDPKDAEATLEILAAQGEKATVIGKVTSQEGIDIQ